MQHPPSLAGRVHSIHPEGDEAIRQTDSDAALARFSAVQKGYFSDPFIRSLVPRGAHLQPPRPPLINVGTYVRSEAIDRLVNEWLELAGQDGRQCQIVSMGAGSDTRFWRIAATPHIKHVAKYIEMDFAENTTKKAMAIRKSKELSALLGRSEEVRLTGGGTGLQSRTYQLVPVDLRRSPHETLDSTLAAIDDQGTPLLSPSLPTLLLFECVLVYMSPEASSALFQWFVDYLSTGQQAILGSIVYEMFGLNDPFGRMMVNNLQARNVSLPGAEPYPDKASLPRRFTQHGFSASHALTLRDIRRSYIEVSEMERISELEMLDEVEELDLVLEHYAITWGLKVYGSQSGMDWSAWGIKRPS